jgi:hypothetical protein
MTKGTWFWLIFALLVLSLVGGYFLWPLYLTWHVGAVVLVLVGLVGWKVFGGPVQG